MSTVLIVYWVLFRVIITNHHQPFTFPFCDNLCPFCYSIRSIVFSSDLIVALLAYYLCVSCSIYILFRRITNYVQGFLFLFVCLSVKKIRGSQKFGTALFGWITHFHVNSFLLPAHVTWQCNINNSTSERVSEWDGVVVVAFFRKQVWFILPHLLLTAQPTQLTFAYKAKNRRRKNWIELFTAEQLNIKFPILEAMHDIWTAAR